MSKRHILHVIYQLSMGGLENGLVNLINILPEEEFYHTILSLKKPDDMRHRLKGQNVNILTLDKQPGPLMSHFWACTKLFKKINPDILHTRNLATLECQLMGWCARIPFRIHSEHGRDAHDIQGKLSKSVVVRKSIKPFVHQYIALSRDLKQYLTHTIGVNSDKVSQIYNGVDTQRFTPHKQENEKTVILSAGRLDAVKDFTTLIKAFVPIALAHEKVELHIAGAGEELEALRTLVHSQGIASKVQFLGLRDDMPQLMAQSDLYVQTSLFEGISNTLLEAMSSGCAIIATNVGGNPELIEPYKNGILIESKDVSSLTSAMHQLIQDKTMRESLQKEARKRACQQFSLSNMVQGYAQLYRANKGVLCAA